MRTLCVDSGNSRIKWALREGAAWGEQGTCSAAQFDQMVVAADRVVACNVGGAAAQQAIEALATRSGLPIDWLRAQRTQCDVVNGYDHPEQLGADRWAALIGAHDLHRGDCVVVMCGTATTVDLLRADGRFEGGLILPGLDLMREALASGTADLPAAAGNYADQPRNTFDAIASGAVHATAGAIERMFRHLDPALEPLCLISGGAAASVAPRLSIPHRIVGNLVLEGLARYATSSARPMP